MTGSSMRVGLIGYGLGGSAFHAPLVAATPGLHLAAVVTRDAERRREVERHYPGTRLLASVDELWAMAPELDLVVVSSPNATHVPYALAALEAKVHVVVDKPFAATATEAREVGALASRVNRLAIPFRNRRAAGCAHERVGLARRIREARARRAGGRAARWWHPGLRGVGAGAARAVGMGRRARRAASPADRARRVSRVLCRGGARDPYRRRPAGARYRSRGRARGARSSFPFGTRATSRRHLTSLGDL